MIFFCFPFLVSFPPLHCSIYIYMCVCVGTGIDTSFSLFCFDIPLQFDRTRRTMPSHALVRAVQKVQSREISRPGVSVCFFSSCVNENEQQKKRLASQAHIHERNEGKKKKRTNKQGEVTESPGAQIAQICRQRTKRENRPMCYHVLPSH